MSFEQWIPIVHSLLLFHDIFQHSLNDRVLCLATIKHRFHSAVIVNTGCFIFAA